MASWHPAILLGAAAAVTTSCTLASCRRPSRATPAPATPPRRPRPAGAAGGGEKRVLVTGCSGSIGRPVCAWLKRCGHTVVGFDAVAAPCAHPHPTLHRGPLLLPLTVLLFC